MRSGKRARLLFAAVPAVAVLAAGCGNFWQPPSSTTSSGCTTNCTTASSSNFYILDGGTNPGIVGYTIVSGALAAISGSPWLVSGVPYSMAMDPAGNFLIVSTTSGVFSFPIANGVLGTGVQVTTDQAAAVQVDATSSWLLEAIAGTGGVTIGAVPIARATGAGNGKEYTVAFTVTNAALQPNRMVISGDNAHVFVALGTGGTILVPFTANAASGTSPLGSTATVIAVANAGGSALSVAVDPGVAPRLFYIGEALGNAGGASGGLRVFNYSSLGGTLTQATGSPIASGGLAPSFILPLSTGTYAGQYVYVANGQGTSAGNVAGFTITAGSSSKYTIATDTTSAAGAQPLGMAEDASGTFVFEVGSAGSPYFDAYTFDATSLGQLDSQLTATTASSSVAVVAAP